MAGYGTDAGAGENAQQAGDNVMEKIVLVGFGGHGKSVADAILRQKKYKLIGFTDMSVKKPYMGCPYLGTDDILKDLFLQGVDNAFIGIGYMGKSKIRDRLYDKALKIGYKIPCVIDPSAVVSGSALLGSGVFVGKNAVINAEADIGDMCIINTGAIVEHECRVGSFSHIAVGATLCGNVNIGNHVLIGAGTTIIQGCYVGDEAIVGAGSMVLKDVEPGGKRYGLIK